MFLPIRALYVVAREDGECDCVVVIEIRARVCFGRIDVIQVYIKGYKNTHCRLAPITSENVPLFYMLRFGIPTHTHPREWLTSFIVSVQNSLCKKCNSISDVAERNATE